MRFGYLRDLHDFLQWRTGDAILLAEANILPADNMKYFGPEGDRMHMILNFQVNQTMFYAFASATAAHWCKALMATRKRPETGQWGIFLRSHDELDLGPLSDEQRQTIRHLRAGRGHAPLPARHPAAPGSYARWRPVSVWNWRTACFSAYGTPVLRYGDEIGMGDNLSLPERQSVRTPMQWTADRHGGFSVRRNQCFRRSARDRTDIIV